MDLTKLSRKELQALCKSNGIPANKSNVFMVDALTTKRIPLLKVDVNRNQKTVQSIGSPSFKSPPLVRKTNATDVNGTGCTEQKPPLFQNNFLRRGKRKDAPTAHEIDQKEKPKVQSISSSYSGLRKPSIDLSQRSSAGATYLSNAKTETIGARALPPAKMVSTKSKVERGLSGSQPSTLSGIAKGKIEDRMRSQIDAALCSKVMKEPERRPSSPTYVESSERVLESNMTVDEVENSECVNLPLEHPEQQSEIFHAKVENSECVNLPLEHPEQQSEIFHAKVENSECVNLPLDHPEQQSEIFLAKVENSDVLKLPLEYPEEQMNSSSFPEPLVQVVQRSAASPPLSLSPLVRLEDTVGSIVDRVQNFWKGCRDLLAVKSFGSPVQ